MGGRGRHPTSNLLSATGEFKKRIRRQLEGVPEMITDVKKALCSGKVTNNQLPEVGYRVAAITSVGVVHSHCLRHFGAENRRGKMVWLEMLDQNNPDESNVLVVDCSRQQSFVRRDRYQPG